jgi:hypothetical protein
MLCRYGRGPIQTPDVRRRKDMKRWMTQVFLVLALVSVCRAAEETTPPPYDNTISDVQALDIAEATFRYQFLHNASGQQQKAPAYFLTVFGKDPDAAFLKRFDQHKPPVEKGTDFAERKGLKFRVERIKRVSATKVEVSGGYYEGGLSSSGNTYFVEIKDGKWVVTGDKMHWIS